MCSRLMAPGILPGDLDRFVRTNVAARLTGVPPRTLRYWASTKRVDARRFGRRQWLFRLGELLRFVALE